MPRTYSPWTSLNVSVLGLVLYAYPMVPTWFHTMVWRHLYGDSTKATTDLLCTLTARKHIGTLNSSDTGITQPIWVLSKPSNHCKTKVP